MPENNVAEKYWLTNKQVIAAFGFFIMMGVGYGEFRGMQSDDKVIFMELGLIKKRAQKEEGEMKSLVYTKARENNEKTGRMVYPIEARLLKVEAWMNYEKGLQAGSTRRP